MAQATNTPTNIPTTANSAASNNTTKPARIYSIDALRGFDMLVISGLDSLVPAILALSSATWAATLSQQFEHVEWEGFRFYDLIFPLFLFLVGCVLPFSLEKYQANPRDVYWRIARRTLMLVFLGLLANRILQFQFAELRYPGVLQRIGLCYGIAALICVHTGVRAQVATVIAILLGYWALLAWVPVPGGAAGDYTKEGNLCGYLDRLLLPGKINPNFYGYGDNEGILSTIPAVATTLLGALSGAWLKADVRPWNKVAGLFFAGVICLALGWLWSFKFPLIKILWTSSFVLVAGGWSLVLLSLFYAVIDVIGWKRWAFVLVVVGVNAITIYIAPRFIDFTFATKFFLGGVINLATEHWPDSPVPRIILWSGILTLKWLFLWFLYTKRVYLRV